MLNVMPVLLAEDEQPDVFLMERAFGVAEVANPLVAVPDGQEAIGYLQGQGAYADRGRHPEPCLLLLDLKMPVLGGFEVLDWIRNQPGLRDILPVIVLSSSDEEGDVKRAFDLGAHDYFIKPMDFNQLVALARELKRDWLEPLRAGQWPARPERQYLPRRPRSGIPG